jgi:hypothetical protein
VSARVEARRLSGTDLGKTAAWEDADGQWRITITEVHHYADTGSTFIHGDGDESYYLDATEMITLTGRQK